MGPCTDTRRREVPFTTKIVGSTPGRCGLCWERRTLLLSGRIVEKEGEWVSGGLGSNSIQESVQGPDQSRRGRTAKYTQS